MTSAKKDPLLVEDNLSCDLQRYTRAVAAMQYYGARVNSGIACGDSRIQYKSTEKRIHGILPPTLPVACKMPPGQSACYYHMIADGQTEVPKYETYLNSNSAADCIPSASPSPAGERPVTVPTKRTFSSPNNPTVCMVDKVRCVLSSSPTRTKIPVAQGSRSNMKPMNGAYFAPSPPAKPMPIKVGPPSMFGRRDITHNCINHIKQAADMRTIKMCERVIAEAVKSGKNPNEINIPQAALKLVPPLKSVESIKERTFTMQHRLAERLSNHQQTEAASIKAALNLKEHAQEPLPDVNYMEAESNYKGESDNTDESEYPEEQISLIETPSNLIEMSNDSSSEVGCMNKTSEVTIQEDSHSGSDETLTDSFSNQNVKTIQVPSKHVDISQDPVHTPHLNHDPATESLAESLLADIMQKFPSHKELCADLEINKQCAKSQNKVEASNNILNDLNNVMQQHLNEDSIPVADVLSTDTQESCSNDYKNESMCDKKEEELEAQVREIAQRMVQLEPANKKSNVWCGRAKSVGDRSGYAHSTNTGLGFIAHNVPTAEISTCSSSTELSETERKFIQRTVSTYTSRTCCDCEKEIKNLHPTSSHKSVQVSISTRPTSERTLHTLSSKHSYIKENCIPPSCISQELGCGREEKLVGRSKSSRLMTDLKKSQQILGLVDAVLKNEDETSSSECMGDTVRRNSRTATKSHRPRISSSSPDRFVGRECVQHLQLLRNEYIQHIQRQFQNIISLNDFIDKFQSLHFI